MPTKHINYTCDICNYRFNTYEEAKICEDRGVQEEMKIGSLFYGGEFYNKIIFLIAGNRIKGHSNFVSYWAFRDTDYRDSDSIEHHCCGFPIWSLSDGGKITEEVKNMPAFTKALNFAKRHNIKIEIYD
jgi:hypothetical protein